MDTRIIAKSGTKWTSAATIARAVIEILRISILTRFLDEKDFGVVAILTFVYGFIQCFSDLGFSIAIMHKRDLDRDDFSSLFWIQFFVYLILFFVISSLSPFVADFYHEDSVSYLLPIMLASLIFVGIGLLYDTVFQKNMMFRKISIRNIVSAVFSLIVAICMAYAGMGVYSLVFSILSYTAVVNIWNFIAGQSLYRLCFSISIRRVRPLIKIGIYQTSTQIIDYLGSKLDILIVGKILGTDSLGLYSLADTLLHNVTYLTLSIANKVSLPIMSCIQNDMERMKSSYCNIIKIVTSINIPILVIVGALSYPIVAIVYGERYLEIAPLVSILALAYIGNCICFPVGNVIIPTGRTDLAFYYTIVRLIIVIPVVCAFSMMGLTALTWGRTIVNFIIIFISWYIEIWQIIKLRLIKLLHSFVSNLIIGVICGILGYFVVKYNSLNIHTGIAQLLIYTLLTLSFYVALQFFFNKKENVELFELVGARTLKKKPV